MRTQTFSAYLTAASAPTGSAQVSANLALFALKVSAKCFLEPTQSTRDMHRLQSALINLAETSSTPASSGPRESAPTPPPPSNNQLQGEAIDDPNRCITISLFKEYAQLLNSFVKPKHKICSATSADRMKTAGRRECPSTSNVQTARHH